jgi:hypothetical protein
VPLCRLVLRRANFNLFFQPRLSRPPGVFKTALWACQIREDVGQVSEGVGVDFKASGDRSIRVWALDQQDSHGTLLVDLLR